MNTQNFSANQRFALVLLRILIGWHFLYEGVIKAYNPAWTAKGYLLSASVLKPFFAWLAHCRPDGYWHKPADGPQSALGLYSRYSFACILLPGASSFSRFATGSVGRQLLDS